MKFRNYLIALACLVAFVGVGYLYVRMWVVQKPFGIILFISDGIVSRHITMARLYSGGAEARLELEQMPHLALLRNDAGDYAVPDEASAATALATGKRGHHRRLAQNQAGHNLNSILALARKEGRTVGIVTNCELTAPTPAAFYAHSDNARATEPLALQLVHGFRPDVALGGGSMDFLPNAGGGRRADGRDLVKELRDQNCVVVRTKAELEGLGPYQERGVVGLFSGGVMSFADEPASGNEQPSLADMVRRAIVFLQHNRQGYLLVVDAGLVGTAASRNEAERAIRETLVLDKAIATAQSYAGKKSLVLAVGRHARGGLTMNGFPGRGDSGKALLGTNPEGYPYLTWATGPSGPVPGFPALGLRQEPAASFATTALNNAEDVLALGVGIGADRLHGVQNNTAVFRILKEAL